MILRTVFSTRGANSSILHPAPEYFVQFIDNYARNEGKTGQLAS